MSQFFCEWELLEEELCQLSDFLGHLGAHDLAAAFDVRDGVARGEAS